MAPRKDTSTRPTTREAIAQAITGAVQYLAGVCNYARTWDGHGFNKPDSHLGHDLAERSGHRALTDDELYASWALCWKYDRTQLQKVDSILPDQATAARLFGSDTPPRIERTRGTITLEGDALLVRCPYDPGITEVLRHGPAHMTVDIFGKLYPNIAQAEIPHQEAKKILRFLDFQKGLFRLSNAKNDTRGVGKVFLPRDVNWSGSRTALPLSRPLRTARASFPASSSSRSNAPSGTRFLYG